MYGRNLGGTRFKGGLGCLGKGTLSNLEEALEKARLGTSDSDIVKSETKHTHTHTQTVCFPPTLSLSLTLCSVYWSSALETHLLGV